MYLKSRNHASCLIKKEKQKWHLKTVHKRGVLFSMKYRHRAKRKDNFHSESYLSSSGPYFLSSSFAMVIGSPSGVLEYGSVANVWLIHFFETVK